MRTRSALLPLAALILLSPALRADDAADARWVPVRDLVAMEPQFHDDHFHILDSFLQLTGDP